MMKIEIKQIINAVRLRKKTFIPFNSNHPYGTNSKTVR